MGAKISPFSLAPARMFLFDNKCPLCSRWSRDPRSDSDGVWSTAPGAVSPAHPLTPRPAWQESGGRRYEASGWRFLEGASHFVPRRGGRVSSQVQKVTAQPHVAGRPGGSVPRVLGSRRRWPGPTISKNVDGTSVVAFSLILVQSDKRSAQRHLSCFEAQLSNVEAEEGNGLLPGVLVPRSTPQHARPLCDEGRAAGGSKCAPSESTDGIPIGAAVSCFGVWGRSSLSSTHWSLFMKHFAPSPALMDEAQEISVWTCLLQARLYLEQVDGFFREEAGGGGEAKAQGGVRAPPSSHSTCLPSKPVCLIPSLVRFRRGYSEGDKGDDIDIERSCRAVLGGGPGPGRPPALLWGCWKLVRVGRGAGPWRQTSLL